MTAKELKEFQYLEQEIEIFEDELRRLKSQYGTHATIISDMPKGNGGGRSEENLAIRVADLEAKIYRHLERIGIKRAELIQFILEIDDSLTRQIFLLRYIKCKTWNEVASAIGGGNTWESVRKRAYRYLQIQSETKQTCPKMSN